MRELHGRLNEYDNKFKHLNGQLKKSEQENQQVTGRLDKSEQDNTELRQELNALKGQLANNPILLRMAFESHPDSRPC